MEENINKFEIKINPLDFHIGLKLNRNFGEFLHKIFHKNKRR